MTNLPSRSLTLFSEQGTIKSISNNKLVLVSDRGASIEIYVPNKIPCALNDHVEIAFEITEYGFIGRQVVISQSGQKWPILPSDFLILSEYLRLSFISLIGMIAFVMVGLFFPVYFLSLVFGVFLAILAAYYILGAFKIGKGVPNYNRATVSPFAGISPEKYSQFFIKNSPPPLFMMDGTFKMIEGTPVQGVLVHGGQEFPINPLFNPQLKKLINLERNWIVSFRNDQVNLLGWIERGEIPSWILSSLFSKRILFEVCGYVVYFLSIIPAYILYGLGGPVPFPIDMITSLFITCLFVGSCLILVGKIVGLKKRRVRNNILVDYHSK